MLRLVWVCIAGAAGTGTRYLLGLWAGNRFETAFPVGTLIVNVVGCFLISLVIQVSLRVSQFPPDLRVILTTGFMGGLTTYSSFNFETMNLWLSGARRLAVLNFGITTVGCLVSGLLGLMVARRFLG